MGLFPINHTNTELLATYDNYVVLDIENPNARGNSICALGLLIVKNGIIADKKYTLLNPEDRFDRTNSQITGLTESMVLNSPILKDFWPEISHILSSETIVGHNIKYDLSVLSKALYRYNIKVPAFKYICTLELSQNFISTQSYSLTNLMSQMGISYNAHNALEDAYAAYYLFKNLTNTFGVKNVLSNTYKYEYRLNNNLDSKLSSNINDLHGIIAGITYDGTVDNAEVQLLQKWFDNNVQYKEYALFHNILSELAIILEDGIVTSYEMNRLTTLVDSINHSKIYNDSTLRIQVLEGILKGISCNEQIADIEVVNLKSWLEYNDYLKGVYPYDKIVNAIEKILSDGIVTEEEIAYLSCEINEILNPIADCTDLELNGKTFCLTGDFKSGTKAEIEKRISEKGGIKKTGVSGNLNYLFVGGLGSDAWKYGNIGGKIAKAQELQEKGKDIKIISEDDLLSHLI